MVWGMEANESRAWRLEAAVAEKLGQWGKEAAISAMNAIKSGRDAKLVVYPTGLKRMRFAEPFADYGMHYEVPVDVWEELTNAKKM